MATATSLPPDDDRNNIHCYAVQPRLTTTFVFVRTVLETELKSNKTTSVHNHPCLPPLISLELARVELDDRLRRCSSSRASFVPLSRSRFVSFLFCSSELFSPSSLLRESHTRGQDGEFLEASSRAVPSSLWILLMRQFLSRSMASHGG